jgi:hypothetical protein
MPLAESLQNVTLTAVTLSTTNTETIASVRTANSQKEIASEERNCAIDRLATRGAGKQIMLPRGPHANLIRSYYCENI